MKKYLFLLISVFMMAVSSEAADNSDEENSIKLDTSETLKKNDKDKKKLEFDTSKTFKKDDDKKLKFDSTETFKKSGDKKLEFDSSTTLKKDAAEKLKFDSTETFKFSNKQSTVDIIKKIKELIKADPKKAESLTAKANDITKLLKEAQKYKDIETAKACTKAVNSLKTMAKFHNGKKVSDKQLYNAYNDCKSIDNDIKKFKMRIESAKRNTPQAIKIRTLQFAAKDDLRKAERAAGLGQKAKAEYYKTCAKIKQNAADNYTKNPKIEEISKQQIRKAVTKYYKDYNMETAARFKKRAKKYRDLDDEERTGYYEKAAALKEKLAEAYAKEDKSLIKSLQKEYKELQKTKK